MQAPPWRGPGRQRLSPTYPPLPCSHLPARLPSRPQSYDKHLREQRKAEERRQRAEQKAAKEENKRQQELRSYKGLMRVGAVGPGGCSVYVLFARHCHWSRSACLAAQLPAALLPGLCLH